MNNGYNQYMQNNNQDFFSNMTNNFDKEYNAQMYGQNNPPYPNQMQNDPRMMPNAQYQTTMLQNQNFQNYTNQYAYPSNNDYYRMYGPEIQQAQQKTGSNQTLIVAPKSFQELQQAIESLRNGQTIILNVNGMKNTLSQRVMDYMSGAVYAVDGSLQLLQNGMYLVTPSNNKIKVLKDLSEDRK